MTSPGGKPDPPPRQASTSRLWALLGILCVVFTVGEWGCKLYEILTEQPDRKAQAEAHPSAFATALQTSVDRRLDQLKQVDAAGPGRCAQRYAGGERLQLDVSVHANSERPPSAGGRRVV